MRAYALGAVDFLFKPIIPEVLLAKVRVFIDLFDKTLQISRHAEELREVERRHHELRLEQERRYWRESQLREELALERRIYADRQRQVAILRSIGDAVVAADGDWRITLLNPAAERLTGWSESEALRQPLSRVVRLLDRRTRAPVPISSDGSNPELVLVDRNGREVPVGQNVAAVLAEEQRRVGVVLVLRAEANARRSESFARIRSNAALALESGAVHPSVRPLLNEIKSVCDSQVSSPTVGVSGTYAKRAVRLLLVGASSSDRGVLEGCLQEMGHCVQAVETGEEAVLSYRRSAEDGELFDAVFLDLNVVGWKTTLAELHGIDPKVCVVALSSRSNDGVMTRHRALGFFSALAKPIHFAMLARELHQIVLGRARTSSAAGALALCSVSKS